jgi:hypothetical protein
LKADIAQVFRAPLGGCDARLMIRGIGGDARNGQEPEQPGERALPTRGEMIEDARQLRLRCAGLFHRYTSTVVPSATDHPRRSGSGRDWTFGFGYVSWGKELFAELHVDGLGTFTTAIRLGFEGHALAFIHGGKT